MNRIVVLAAALVCVGPNARAQQPAPPQAAVQPLPPVKELLQQVEQNEKISESLRNDYIYHVHFEEQDFASNGAVKKTTTTDSESLTVDGVRIDRIVARNGQPLTPEEKAKEDKRIDDLIARAKRKREKLENKGEDTNTNGEAMMPASRFLELGTFSNPRRMTLNGRPTIVLDYAGDPHAKTKTEMEGIVRDLVGTIWVDEADRVMVKAQGRFLKDFKVGGGLIVDIHAGLNFGLTKEKINDEVWLPREIDGAGSGRILLFVKVDGRVKWQMSNYQKFRTGATIIPSDRLVGPDGQILPDQKAAPETKPKP